MSSFLHFYSYSHLKVSLFAVLALQLAACSGGAGGDSIGNSGDKTILNKLGLTWTAPSERVDGTALSLSEIAGYRIYYGAETESYQNLIDINDISADQTQIADLAPGTYYVVMTTIDSNGLESTYSSEVVVTL